MKHTAAQCRLSLETGIRVSLSRSLFTLSIDWSRLPHEGKHIILYFDATQSTKKHYSSDGAISKLLPLPLSQAHLLPLPLGGPPNDHYP